MKPIEICRHCKGKGKVKISGALLATFTALQIGPATPPDIFARLKRAGNESKSIATANNALEKLRELKLATRAKVKGIRGYIYSIAKKTT